MAVNEKKRVSPEFVTSFLPGDLKKLKDIKDSNTIESPKEESVPKKVEKKSETFKEIENPVYGEFLRLLDFYSERKETCLVNIDPELRDFICRLKLNTKFRRFSYRDIASAMMHAYIKEHQEDFVQLIKETYKVTIFD